jgi:hypothetical protein
VLSDKRHNRGAERLEGLGEGGLRGRPLQRESPVITKSYSDGGTVGRRAGGVNTVDARLTVGSSALNGARSVGARAEREFCSEVGTGTGKERA